MADLSNQKISDTYGRVLQRDLDSGELQNLLGQNPNHLVFNGTTIRYVDGNQQDGYVLTSDSSGNVRWAPSSGGGGGTISGGGLLNYITKWTGVTGIGISSIIDDSNLVTVNNDLFVTGTTLLPTLSSDTITGNTIYGVFTQKTGITVSSTSWTFISGVYEYEILDTDITEDFIVDVVPNNEDYDTIIQSVMFQKTVSSLGSVKIFAKNQPLLDMTVTINIFR
jgi:hypothetical protein